MPMRRSRDPASRYRENMRREQETADEFIAHETEWADNLLLWYKARKQEIPDDEYRAACYFKNFEFILKPSSLLLLYRMYERCVKELPEATKETAFHLLAYRFKMYAAILAKGGYDGQETGTD